MTQDQWQGFWRLLGFLVVCNAITTEFGSSASAQIVPDNTLGNEQSQVTNNSNIRGLPAQLIEGGAVRGVNLFQSFSQFHVGDGERVYFANPANIQNILSRVTGKDPSKIFGTLGVNGNANLFFINPNGIIFGQNAKLDVAGSFLASTANSFVFENGMQFSATNPEAPPLLVVNIRPGLQFGTDQQGNIVNTGNLKVGQDFILAAHNLDLQGQLQAGKDLTLQAQETVKVRDRIENPFIASAGGKLTVQGNQQVDIFALNHPSSGLFSGGDMVLRSANTVGGDAHYSAGGNFKIEKLDGSAGNLFSPYDPIILAQGNVSLGDYRGASLHILAGGSVKLDDVTITGPDETRNTINPNSFPDFATVTLWDGTTLKIDGSARPTLDVRAGIDWNKLGGSSRDDVIGNVSPEFIPPTVTAANIVVDNVNSNSPESLVFLTNRYNRNPALQNGLIEIKNIIDTSVSNDKAGDVVVDALGNIRAANIFSYVDARGSGSAGNISLFSERGSIDTTAGTLDSPIQVGRGGNITLKAAGNIFTSNIFSYVGSGGSGRAGDIKITSENGSIETRGSVNSVVAGSGYGGNISLIAASDIKTSDIRSDITDEAVDNGGIGNGGKITIISRNGKIDTSAGIVNSRSFGNQKFFAQGGNISLTADGDIKTGEVVSYIRIGGRGNGGDIQLNSTNGEINTTAGKINSTTFSGKSGDISLTAARDIKTSEVGSYIIKGGNGRAGNINIDSRGGLINTTGGTLAAQTDNGISGNITLKASENINTAGVSSFSNGEQSEDKAGDVNINSSSGKFSLNGHSIITQTDGSNPSGNITIEANSIELSNSAKIQAQTYGTGSGGNVVLRTNGGTISLTNQVEIQAQTHGKGDAGTVVLQTNGDVSLDNSRIFSTVESGGEGKGGDIRIYTRTFSMSNGSGLQTLLRGSSEDGKLGGAIGKAGNVFVQATNSVSLRNSLISSIIQPGSESTGGNTFAGDLFNVLQGQSDQLPFGSIIINTRELTLADSQLDASTSGKGNAGGILVLAKDNVSLSNSSITTETKGIGDAGGILVLAKDKVSLLSNSSILSTVGENAEGSAGGIGIEAGSLSLANGAQLNGSTSGKGNAGNIFVKVDDFVSLSDSSYVISTVQAGAEGDGGEINIESRTLNMTNGSRFQTGVFRSDSGLPGGKGKAGDIVVRASDSIKLSGINVLASGLFTSTEVGASGLAGDITVTTGNFQVTDGAIITAKASSNDNAGNINLTANRLTLDNGSITAETASTQGGNITLNLRDLLLLRHNSQISATAGQNGSGGNITITNLSKPFPFIVAVPGDKNNNDIIANAANRQGGKITINASGIYNIKPLSRAELQRLNANLQPRELLTNDITAVSQQGGPQLDGRITINNPDVDPSNGIVSLPVDVVDPSNQIAQGCAAFDEATASDFKVTGRGGLPPSPDETLSSDAVWEDTRLRTVTAQRLDSKTTATKPNSESEIVKITPATDWKFNGKGEVTLISQTPNATAENLAASSRSCRVR